MRGVDLRNVRLPQIVVRPDRTRVAARRSDGSLVSLSELPARDVRWTTQRKRVVVDCVSLELLSLAAAEQRYDLTPSELAEWRATVNANGRIPAVWPDRPRRVTGGILRMGPVEVDLTGNGLRLEGRPVSLSGTEWRVLATLAEAGGAIVTNAMLIGALYPDTAPAGRKIIDVIICRLRRKLGAAADVVEAVWGRGYRLAGDATTAAVACLEAVGPMVAAV